FSGFVRLEHHLLAKGGKLYLQIRGVAGPLRDTLFSAALQQVAAPSTDHFTATFSGANEFPPNASQYRGTATFSLTVNCLFFSFAVDLDFPGFSAGVYGPADPHSNSTNLVSDLGALFGVFIPPGSPGFTGQI